MRIQLIMQRMYLRKMIPAVFVMMWAAAPALAQEVDRAPETAMTQSLFILMAIVLGAMVVGVSIMSSRRGHQD